VVDRRHYDAFGKERRGIVKPNSPDMVAPLLAGYTGYGFTGHRQLESVGLVHMGGRVYDPELGRFLSADPFIQFALNTQSFNRYSYVLNNPLSFNDPSGYFLGKLFKGIVRAVTGVFKAVLLDEAAARQKRSLASSSDNCRYIVTLHSIVIKGGSTGKNHFATPTKQQNGGYNENQHAY
jgi:RHS repeat-associated protein